MRDSLVGIVWGKSLGHVFACTMVEKEEGIAKGENKVTWVAKISPYVLPRLVFLRLCN